MQSWEGLSTHRFLSRARSYAEHISPFTWVPSQLILFCLGWNKTFLACGSKVMLASLFSSAFLSDSENQSWHCWDVPYSPLLPKNSGIFSHQELNACSAAQQNKSKLTWILWHMDCIFMKLRSQGSLSPVPARATPFLFRNLWYANKHFRH